MAKNNQPIIIKKVKKGGHAHHGGAWKIAYADFVTAMMAFFLLMWLISMTTQEQKEGLAEYFAPAAVSLSNSGAGGVLGGNAMDNSGNRMSGSSSDDIRNPTSAPKSAVTGETQHQLGGQDLETGSERRATSDSEYNLKSIDAEAFHSAAASIRQALQALPEVTPYEDNLLIEMTEDGLDILIVDQDGRPMFPEGSKYPLEPTRLAIAAIAPILQQLNAQVTISGHTAAGRRYDDPRYGAWELSADRANMVRAVLEMSGLSADRIKSVIGRATNDPFFLDDPYMAANERVRVSVLFPPPPVPVGLKP
jgi:chemotaxis protein MotB